MFLHAAGRTHKQPDPHGPGHNHEDDQQRGQQLSESPGAAVGQDRPGSMDGALCVTFQGTQQLFRRGGPVAWTKRQRLPEHRCHPIRNVGWKVLQGWGLLQFVVRSVGIQVEPEAGRPTHQHLIQHRAQGVDVRPAIQIPTPHRLLGAHVPHGPHRETRERQSVPARCAERLGDPEVGHHRTPRREEDVLGLDIAVHHAPLVRVDKGRRHVAGDLQGLGEGERALPIHAVTQRLPFHARHDVVEDVVGTARVVQRDDADMVQLSADLDFTEEASRADGTGDLGTQDLDRHVTVVLEILRQIDGGHATATEPSSQLVAASEVPVQAGEVVGHALSLSRWCVKEWSRPLSFCLQPSIRVSPSDCSER